MYASTIIVLANLYTYHIDLWPVTLKTLSVIPTHMLNICSELNSLQYVPRDIVSCKRDVMDNRPLNGHCTYGIQMYNLKHNASAVWCWWRSMKKKTKSIGVMAAVTFYSDYTKHTNCAILCANALQIRRAHAIFC